MLFLLYELSTPFLNAAWLLSRGGCQQKWLVTLCGGLLIVSFFLVRLVFGPYFVFFVWRDLIFPEPYMTVLPVAKYFYTVASAVLTLLNVFWFYKIIQFAKGASLDDNERAKAKQNTNKKAN
jgi:hypothetical protein